MAKTKLIEFQVLDPESEEWKHYYSCCAEINKASGREYFNARTTITENTYNFKVGYIGKLENIVFNTSQYRIIYRNRIFDIINSDDKQEKHINVTFTANCVTI